MPGGKSAANVYAELMFPKGHGLGLWFPEPSPSLINPSVTGELFIGDVGYVEDGGFIRLFNITRPADDPINLENGIPDGFSPLIYHHSLERRRPCPLGTNPICSRDVKYSDMGLEAGAGVLGATAKSAFRVACKSDRGAMLMAQDNMREFVVPNEAFKRYMLEHHQSWCDKARALDHSSPDGDIILVVGVTKTSEWTVAAWGQTGHTFGMLAGAEGGGVATAGGWVGRVHLTGSSVESRTSMDLKSHPPTKAGHSPKPDHCVFLSYYKIKKRLWLPPKIEARAGPHELPPDDRDDEAAYDFVVQNVPASDKFDDPLDHLLDHILETTGTEVAIASHLDIKELLGGEDWPEDLTAYLREHQPLIDVNEGKVGSLPLTPAIRRNLEREVQEARVSSNKRHPGLPSHAPTEPAKTPLRNRTFAALARADTDDDDEAIPPVLLVRPKPRHNASGTRNIIQKDKPGLD